MTKDDWLTVTEVPAGEIIKNATDKYNNMVAEKWLTKTNPKDAKIIPLTTFLYKL